MCHGDRARGVQAAMNGPRRGLILSLGVGALLVLVGAVLLRGALEPSAADAGLPSAGPVIDAGAIAKLDPESRELALAIPSAESVDATYIAADRIRAEAVAAAARSAGLEPHVSIGEDATVSMFGPIDRILALLSNPSVGRAEIREDTRALRPAAAPLAAGWSMPVPGRPYAGDTLPVDPTDVLIPAQRRAFLFATVADLVVTIDGAPYDRLRAEGTCGGGQAPECQLYLYGLTAGAPFAFDTWSIHATAAMGWLARIDPGDGPYLAGIPRWLAREAERIARDDPAASHDLAAYSSILGFTWDPARPGVISVTYGRDCVTSADRRVASLGALPFADTGECIDILTVVVDVGTAKVVDVRENLAGN